VRRYSAASNIRWGLGATLVCLVAVYFAFGATNPFSHPYEIKAIFASAASEIQPQSPVRIAGVNVGAVTKVSRGPGTTALVTMAINNKGRPIHADATMKIRPRLFLEGNFFIDLQPGSPSAHELASGKTVPLSQTAIPVQVDQVLDTFTSDARTGMQQVIQGLGQSLQKGGAQGLANAYREFAPTGIPLARSMRALRGQRPDDLSTFIRDTAQIAGVVDARKAQLTDLITTFRQTMGAFADRQSDLRKIFTGLDQTLRDADPTLSELDAVLPPLRSLATALRPAFARAPRVLDDSQPFLTAAAQLLAPSKAPALLKQLGPSVQQLNGLETDLPALLNLVTPVANCVTNRVVPILGSSVDDGNLSTGQPVWQEAVRFPIGLGSAAQNFSGSGYSVRYSFGIDQTAIGTPLVSPDNLFMLSGQPVLGARPQYTPGSQPPFKPDVPCESQPLTSLKATNAPATATQRSVRLRTAPGWSAKQLSDRLASAVKVLTGKKAGG
jgi:phospholipid/cholesterol/gamma-HCH transport system substrate-binding protein